MAILLIFSLFMMFCFFFLAYKLLMFIVMKFLRCEIIHINGSEYEARYYKNAENNGAGNYSVEILINSNDKIILDDLSLEKLEWKTYRVLYYALFSRQLINLIGTGRKEMLYE